MIAPEDENESEVRREDQDRINQFARLNARKQDVVFEQQQLKKELEGLDDACTELMMGPSHGINDDDDDLIVDNTTTNKSTSNTNNIMIYHGETFFTTTEDDATTYCETKIDMIQQQLQLLQQEHDDILQQQILLKQLLYGRFGKSINLETE